MEGSPLNQFVILAKSAQGKACEALVRDALEHTGVFVFGELLNCPNVEALGGSPSGKQMLSLMRIFAFGVYSDYKQQKAEMPELTPNQLRKLQLLTVVSLATKEKHIKFSDLQAAVDITGSRATEDLIIEAVYKNLIVGKMDQEKQCLIVEWCFSRDCKDEDLDYIIDTLTSWQDSAQQMMLSLDGMVKHSHDSNSKHTAAREELDKVIQQTKEACR